MRKKAFMTIPVLLLVMLPAFYFFNMQDKSGVEGETSPATVPASAAGVGEGEVTAAENQEIKKLKTEIEKLKSQIYKNLSYEMFYGEWEATGRVYVDPVPVRGIRWPKDEIESVVMKNILEGIETKTVQFTWKNVVINGDRVIENIKYDYRIFPANDNYRLHFEITLKDIGLSEAVGKYFVFAMARSEEYSYFEGSEFFIKDENTLVVRRNNYSYVEYTRTSYNGGSAKPVIVSG